MRWSARCVQSRGWGRSTTASPSPGARLPVTGASWLLAPRWLRGIFLRSLEILMDRGLKPQEEAAVLRAVAADAKRLTPVMEYANYQLVSSRVVGDGWALVGDTAGFIDPVFSTGVLLAMQSGFDGADTVETCLDRPHAAAAALRAFDRSMRHGPKIFSWFIYRMTNPAMRELFMYPRNPWRVKEALLSLLAALFLAAPDAIQ